MSISKTTRLLLVVVNGYLLFQLFLVWRGAEAQVWPVGDDVSWQWARLLIPAMMIGISGMILFMDFLLRTLISKFKEN